MCFLLYPKDFFSGLLVTRGCETLEEYNPILFRSDALLDIPDKGTQTELFGSNVHCVEFVQDYINLVIINNGDNA